MRRLPIIISLIFFSFLSFVLPWITAFSCMKVQGRGPNEVSLCDFLFPVANWPSLLINIYPSSTIKKEMIGYDIGSGLFNPSVIIINAIGWIIVGFFVGLIVSIVLKQRKNADRKQNQKM